MVGGSVSKLWTPFGLFVLDPEWFFGVGFPLNKTVGSPLESLRFLLLPGAFAV